MLLLRPFFDKVSKFLYLGFVVENLNCLIIGLYLVANCITSSCV